MLAQRGPEGAWTVDQPREAHSCCQHPEPCFCPVSQILTELISSPACQFLKNSVFLVSTVRLSSQTAPGIYSGWDIQSILVCRFYICSFTYWLKFICDPQINTCGTSADMCRVEKTLSLLTCSAFLLQLLYYIPVSSSLFIWCWFFFFLFCVFFVGVFVVSSGPKYRAEVLSRVPKCKKAVMFLTEKIHVLEKLYSGIYSAVG